MVMDWGQIVEDGVFAAMAAIGFSSISHIPQRTYMVCGLAAAVGHSLRMILMSPETCSMNIILASTIAAFAIGLVAVMFAPVVKVPAEACLFPALLPMIPGMYAYRAISGLVGCVASVTQTAFLHDFYILGYNGMMCLAIVLGMVLGANIPIFMLKKVSFQATR